MDHYYHAGDLGRFAEMGKGSPELWQKFQEYYAAVFAEGALTEREKALIALGVAHAVQCPYCIDAYSRSCLEKGSNVEEMTDAVLARDVQEATRILTEHILRTLEAVRQIPPDVLS